jgi:phage terminase large subunit-like protein
VRGVPLVIGTAQNLDIAEEVWQGAVDIAEGTPELDAEIGDIIRSNGKKTLTLQRGERYKVQAANRRGGRGLSGDVVMLDELREHQTWDAWSAVTKTTMARAHAQVWAVSNAGDVSSVVLAHLRSLAHKALGDPDGLFVDEPNSDEEVEPEVEISDEDLAIFEWSAPPGCKLDDPEGWAWSNPSLGHTITERAIRSAMRTDPEAVFRTEVLCQWVDTFVPSVIPLGKWDLSGEEDHRADGGLSYALDVDSNAAGEEWCSIGTSDGEHVEIVTPAEAKPGLAWVVPAVKAKFEARVLSEIAVDPKGPAGKLVKPLEKAGVKVRKIKPDEFIDASMQFRDAVADDDVDLVHLDQEVLNRAVAGAQKRDVGDGNWRFSRTRSSADIGPAVAVALARWLALQTVAYDPLDSVR